MQARTAGEEEGAEEGPAAGSPEGVIRIEAACAYAAGLPALAALLADAVKGALPGSPRPLQASQFVSQAWVTCLTGAPGALPRKQPRRSWRAHARLHNIRCRTTRHPLAIFMHRRTTFLLQGKYGDGLHMPSAGAEHGGAGVRPGRPVPGGVHPPGAAALCHAARGMLTH